eukprot:GHVU01066721.1.p1 GENE.GHVU01066721.1~~GHVU01066721.1.p1  ORF type:complete len:484 (-),score=38.85 GHVU01066721.1:922-2373(-)
MSYHGEHEGVKLPALSPFFFCFLWKIVCCRLGRIVCAYTAMSWFQLMQELDEDARTEEVQALSASTLALANTIRELPPHSGSVPWRGPNLARDREGGELRLIKDYFCESPIYPAMEFKRRFRMSRERFMTIYCEFQRRNLMGQGRDNKGQLGASLLQKMTAALRVLAYGGPSDSVDEYLRLSDTLIDQCVHAFCVNLVEVYADTYMRLPTALEVAHWVQFNETHHGLPGMFGSIDCTHQHWDKCPVAHRGVYQGKEHKPSLVIEAVATQDMWLWHNFTGTPGASNDINVFDRSPLLNYFTEGDGIFRHTVSIGEETFPHVYLLTDGIYPPLSFFVKPLTEPSTPQEAIFTQRVESARKDVERAFGALKIRFAVLNNACKYHSANKMISIERACIVIHNMNVEDRRADLRAGKPDDDPYLSDTATRNAARVTVPVLRRPPPVAMDRAIRDAYAKGNHQRLQKALLEYLWARHGTNTLPRPHLQQ